MQAPARPWTESSRVSCRCRLTLQPAESDFGWRSVVVVVVVNGFSWKFVAKADHPFVMHPMLGKAEFVVPAARKHFAR
jgi:hypothetical protein